MIHLFIGCDPGIRGAVALLDIEGGVLFAKEIPTRPAPQRTVRKTKSGKIAKPKMEVDYIGLTNLFNEMMDRPYMSTTKFHAHVERVWARPHEGVTSAFNFGTAYGAIRQILAERSVPVELVLPNEWQTAIVPDCKALKGDAKKKFYHAQAREMFPKCEDILKKEKSHDVAAALLIAEYSRRKTRQGELP